MYLNENGTFSQTPDWTSTHAAATYSVQLGDVDGDGNLDLVCANQGSGNTLYLNTGGTFTESPRLFRRPVYVTPATSTGTSC